MSILPVHGMKESGKTIFNMARVLKPGLMALAMKGTMHLVGSTESGLTNGMTAHNIQETGMKTK